MERLNYGNTALRRHALSLLAALLVAPLTWPILRGEALVPRDVGTTHRPAWALFEAIGFSKINPASSFGQPYRGNPNLLIYYPFPKSAPAVDLHVAAHLAFLAVGMAAWLRHKGLHAGAFAGAATFALSGYVVSAVSSLNALTTIAWIPCVLFAASAQGRRWTVSAVRVAVLALFSVSGEPVLIAATLVLALAAAIRTGKANCLIFLLSGAAALLLTFPIHRETWLAARESQRVVDGYSFSQGAELLHPARLLETVIPGFFGSPAQLGGGAWWGYAVTGGIRPYVQSIFFGLLPLALVTCYGAATRCREHPFWWLLALLGVVVSAIGLVPGGDALWDAIRPLHVIRFPIKAMLFTTLAVAVLTAHAWEFFSGLPRHAPIRRRAASWVGAAAILGLVGTLFGVRRFARMVVGLAWDRRWDGNVSDTLSSTTTVLAVRMAILVVLLTLLFFWIARRPHPVLSAVMLAAIVLDLTSAGRMLVPTIHRTALAGPSPIVSAALRTKGRVFERAFKDLDTPIHGVLGIYPSNDAKHLAVVQMRQGWALAGAAAGLRYAYDRSPDGSYTSRNHLVQDRLENASWERRLKWLRGAGVAAVIASDIPPSLHDFRPIVRDAAIGIPVTLYGIEPRLSELRPAQRVRWVHSAEEAIRVFEQANFDERQEIAVEGTPRPLGASSLMLLSEGPDELTFCSIAEGPSLAFLARSYTRQVRATTATGGPALHVFPANVHLCAIELPPGDHKITVFF